MAAFFSSLRMPFAVRWPRHDYVCGYCPMDHLTLFEHRAHLADTHNIVLRGSTALTVVPARAPRLDGDRLNVTYRLVR